MIFERADRTLGSVSSMHARWDELEVNVFISHVLFEDGRGYVVEALEDGAQASCDEDGEGFFVGAEDGGGPLVFMGSAWMELES
jgi:hypothetical protein